MDIYDSVYSIRNNDTFIHPLACTILSDAGDTVTPCKGKTLTNVNQSSSNTSTASSLQ